MYTPEAFSNCDGHSRMCVFKTTEPLEFELEFVYSLRTFTVLSIGVAHITQYTRVRNEIVTLKEAPLMW